MGLLVMVSCIVGYQKEFVIQRQLYVTGPLDQSVPRISQIILGRRKDTRGIKDHINGQDITLAIMIASVGIENSKNPYQAQELQTLVSI